jgi:hypothetical protein
MVHAEFRSALTSVFITDWSARLAAALGPQSGFVVAGTQS